MLRKAATISFLALVFSLPFANVPFVWFGRPPFQITDLLFILTSALLAAELLRAKRFPQISAFHCLAALYLAGLAVSLFFSVDQSKSTIKFIGVAYLVALALLSGEIVRNSVEFRKTAMVWLAASAIAAAFSVLVLIGFYVDRSAEVVQIGLSHYGTFPVGNYPRVRSFFLNPNMFAHYLVIGWTLLFGAFRLGWVERPMALGMLSLFAVATILTLSPGIGGVLFAAGLWVCFGDSFKKKLVVPVASVLFLGAIAFVAVVLVKVGPDLSVGEGSAVRLLVWQGAFETFVENPLTGKGIGTGATRAGYENQTLTDAHNIFFNVAAESGLLAVVALAAIGIWISVRLFKMRNGGPPGSIIAVMLFCGFVSAFFYVGLSGSFEDARHLWVLMGISASFITGRFEVHRDE